MPSNNNPLFSPKKKTITPTPTLKISKKSDQMQTSKHFLTKLDENQEEKAKNITGLKI